MSDFDFKMFDVKEMFVIEVNPGGDSFEITFTIQGYSDKPLEEGLQIGKMLAANYLKTYDFDVISVKRNGFIYLTKEKTDAENENI